MQNLYAQSGLIYPRLGLGRFADTEAIECTKTITFDTLND